MRFSDMSIGIALICLALAIVGDSSTFPSIAGQPYGPGLFPTLIGIGLAVCGFALITGAWGQRRTVPIVIIPPWMRSLHQAGSVFLCIAAVVFYIAVVDWLGFVLTAFFVLTVLLTWLRRRFWPSAGLAAAVTAVMYISFFYLLSVPLPAGVLRSLTG